MIWEIELLTINLKKSLQEALQDFKTLEFIPDEDTIEVFI